MRSSVSARYDQTKRRRSVICHHSSTFISSVSTRDDIEARWKVEESVDWSADGNMAKINMRRHSATSSFGAHDNAGQKPVKY